MTRRTFANLLQPILSICSLLLVFTVPVALRAADKPRVLVLTDIGGDPDDQQSLVRLMLYTNELEIEGLIASASGTPGELAQRVTRPDLIREIVTAYGKVQPNLRLHDAEYPPGEQLRARIKSGNPNRSLQAIGAEHDTEGSQWILRAADGPDERPLNICIWGGQTDLAQALWRARQDRGDAGLKQLQSRIRIYDIADQDGIASWLWREFPGMFYLLARSAEGRDKREAVFRGMYLGGDESLVSRRWMEEHIRQNQGPLGALYPPQTWTAPNPHSAIKEGDTPSWFYFLPLGFTDPAHPEWGGWGGRFRDVQGIWRDAEDTVEGVHDARCTVWRWRRFFQHDFQARLTWCIQSTDDANHPPVAVVNGSGSREVLAWRVEVGSTIRLSARGSADPDGNALHYRWSCYPEAGSYGKNVSLSGAESEEAVFLTPSDALGKAIHVILEVTDDGTPPLTSFRRVILEVSS